MPAIGASGDEDLAQQPEQQEHVGARPDRQVLVGDLRRLRPSRVDHHEPPAARAQRRNALLESRRAHDRAAGGDRVAADADEQLRAIHVRDRDEELVPEHRVRGHHVGQLVHAGRGIQVLRAHGPDEIAHPEHGAEVVHRGVADVDRHPIRPVAFTHLGNASIDLGESRGPRDLFPARRRTPHRAPQAIGILVDVLEGDGLGADVPAAQHVLAIGLDGQHGAAAMLDDDAAHGLAQGAGAVMQAGLIHQGRPHTRLGSLRRCATAAEGPGIRSAAGAAVRCRHRRCSYAARSS